MKKVLAILLISLITLSLCACGPSKEEKKLQASQRVVRELEKGLARAEQEKDDFEQAVADYEAARERVENAD